MARKVHWMATAVIFALTGWLQTAKAKVTFWHHTTPPHEAKGANVELDEQGRLVGLSALNYDDIHRAIRDAKGEVTEDATHQEGDRTKPDPAGMRGPRFHNIAYSEAVAGVRGRSDVDKDSEIGVRGKNPTDAILTALRQAGRPMTKSEILEKTRLDESRWADAIGSLLRSGQVTQVGEGSRTLYQLRKAPPSKAAK